MAEIGLLSVTNQLIDMIISNESGTRKFDLVAVFSFADYEFAFGQFVERIESSLNELIEVAKNCSPRKVDYLAGQFRKLCWQLERLWHTVFA